MAGSLSDGTDPIARRSARLRSRRGSEAAGVSAAAAAASSSPPSPHAAVAAATGRRARAAAEERHRYYSLHGNAYVVESNDDASASITTDDDRHGHNRYEDRGAYYYPTAAVMEQQQQQQQHGRGRRHRGQQQQQLLENDEQQQPRNQGGRIDMVVEDDEEEALVPPAHAERHVFDTRGDGGRSSHGGGGGELSMGSRRLIQGQDPSGTGGGTAAAFGESPRTRRRVTTTRVIHLDGTDDDQEMVNQPSRTTSSDRRRPVAAEDDKPIDNEKNNRGDRGKDQGHDDEDQNDAETDIADRAHGRGDMADDHPDPHRRRPRLRQNANGRDQDESPSEQDSSLNKRRPKVADPVDAPRPPPHGVSDDADEGDELHTPRRRRESLVEVMRTSLALLLGSAARHAPRVPAMWATGGGAADYNDDDDNDDDIVPDMSGSRGRSVGSVGRSSGHTSMSVQPDDAAPGDDDDDDDGDEIVPDIDDSPGGLRSASRSRVGATLVLAEPYVDEQESGPSFAASAEQLIMRLSDVCASLAVKTRDAVAPTRRLLGKVFVTKNMAIITLTVLTVLSLIFCRFMMMQLGLHAHHTSQLRLEPVRRTLGRPWTFGAEPWPSISRLVSLPDLSFPLPRVALPSVDLLAPFRRPWLSRIPFPSVPHFQIPNISFPSLPAIARPSISRIMSPVSSFMGTLHPERWALFALQKLRTVANDSSLVIASILSDILARARAGGSAVTKALVPVELTTQAASYRSNVNSFIEIYAADKGAPPDYALLSVGAKVLSSSPSMARLYIRFLRNYIVALFPASNIAYMPTPPNSPSIAFMPDITPGNCWAFPGHKGSVTVRLARPIAPTAITIEHTPRSSVFSISSAPRDFAVYVLPLAPSGFPDDSDKIGVLMGRFRYDTSPSAGHLQTFRLARRIIVARAIRIEILSNHGSRTHTCLYRVRVHGKPTMDREFFPNEADILQ